ncbi:MAG: carboxypeptidase-like regulatory domain-containing protein, partial [Maribacter litoralis]|uniref:carboxypeptidase-like regulatory domain-containing protein n=1 Tax=Maribacter litoralis TaxID=2059726 RepID=UPI00329A1751
MEKKHSENQNRTKNSLLLLLFVLVTFGYTTFSHAQNRAINGKILDNAGIPIAGATVTIKSDQTIGVLSDFDGNYSIEVANTESILVFRYLGFVTKEIKVGSNTTIDVTLEEDAMGLDEVILVGYGTQKQTEVTAAISSVDVAEIQKIPTADVGTSLQ